MNQLIISGKSYAIPSDRTELSPSGLKLLGKILLKNLSPVNMHKLVFFVLTSELFYLDRVRLWYWFLFQASTIERGDCLFLVQEFMEMPVPHSPPFKKISCSFVLLYPPKERLMNSTLWEFVQAETFFFLFLKTKDPESLDMLVSILYRPEVKEFNPRYHDDRREPLTDAGLYWISQRIKKMPLAQKMLILQFFDAARMNLISTFKDVFPTKDEEEGPNELFKKAKTSSSPWIPLITSLAGSMTNFKAIGDTNIYIALTDIQERIRRNKK